MSYWLGIDMGCTFTAAAICRQGRFPEVVALGSRSAAVSSVVYLGGDGQVVVGEAAERRAVTDPERVVRGFKRRIGDEVPMVIGGAPHSAPEIAAMVVRWVVDRVAQREGGPATSIVLTHPAGWGSYKIQTMAAALRAAELPEVTFRTEPEAAAASYALQERIESGSTIAVYDLGGGTFDAAVVRKTGSSTFTVLGQPQGIEQLGGVDFDDAVFSHVLAAVPELAELDPEDPATLAATAVLRRECTEAKEALSADTEVTIPVLAPGIQSRVRLVRAEFEDMIRPQVTQTIEALRQALRSAELDPQDLDAVLLVGGSSRVPLVTQLVSAELGRPVAIDADPKAAIALGAALSALPTASTPTAVIPGPAGSEGTGADVAAPPVLAGARIPAEPPAHIAGSGVPVSTPVDTVARPPLTAIPLDVEPVELQWRQTSTRRVKRVALAGMLSLLAAAGVASVPFLTSHSGPTPQAAAGTPAPETATPTADARSGGGNSSGADASSGAAATVPITAANKPTSGFAAPAVAPAQQAGLRTAGTNAPAPVKNSAGTTPTSSTGNGSATNTGGTEGSTQTGGTQTGGTQTGGTGGTGGSTQPGGTGETGGGTQTDGTQTGGTGGGTQTGGTQTGGTQTGGTGGGTQPGGTGGGTQTGGTQTGGTGGTNTGGSAGGAVTDPPPPVSGGTATSGNTATAPQPA